MESRVCISLYCNMVFESFFLFRILCFFRVVNCGQRFTWTPSVSLETVHLNGESLILMH
jgi:hypothetical protein